MPPAFIPRTDIEVLYRDVCKRPGGPQARLDWAAQSGIEETIATAFATSVEQLKDYDNRDEPFLPPNANARTEERDDAANTTSVSLRLQKQKRLDPTDGDGLTYRYVERQVVPQRTAGGARFNDPRQELADGPESSAMKIDLLLEAEDGAPAVGEIKIRTDKDPICALVQVLAAAALLAPEAQRERLDLHHGLRTDGRLDAVILLVDFPEDELMQRAMELARELAEAVAGDARVGEHLRRVVAFEATADATLAGGALTVDLAWQTQTQLD